MLEGKTLIQLLILLFGVPAYIYAFFDNIQTWATSFDVWKGVVLTCIGAFTGVVIGLRQLVRLLNEWDELKKNRKQVNVPDEKMKAV